jgi:hypothetical protein
VIDNANFQTETPTALIAWVISEPLARYEIIEIEIIIKMSA